MPSDPLRGQRTKLRESVRAWAATIVACTCGSCDNPLEDETRSEAWNDAAWDLVCDEMQRIARRIDPLCPYVGGLPDA